MKPIQTKYKGHHFRSRLEARWAVYFDAMKIKWVYEKEGFEFKDGTRYLPDFWFPEAGMWGEVKPYKMPLQSDEMKKAVMLAIEGQQLVVVLDGLPECRNYRSIHTELIDGKPEFGLDIILALYKNNGFYFCDWWNATQYHEDIADACEVSWSKRFEFEEFEGISR